MLNVIPMPGLYYKEDGKIVLERNKIKVDCQNKEIRDRILPMIKELLKSDYIETEENPDIIIRPFENKIEQYSIIMRDGKITIKVTNYRDAIYALSTLRQLFMTDLPGDTLTSRCYSIIMDFPHKKVRGLQLDESRHFFGVETVKKLLDFMSLYKLNRLHWHLTDNQGWRIEIKKYPLLTEIGSKRKGSQLHHWQCSEMDETPHEGFYTQAQIKEIIDYAADRCIEIVPEIDFPAHCASAIAAYNDLACRDIPCEVFSFFSGKIPSSQGITDWNRPLCLGKDESLQFVFDVLDEVCELFPSQFIHVGGDEAPRQEWEKCPHCQKRIKDENLKDEAQLQGWFTNKINEHLKSKNKRMICWNEVLESGIADKDIIIQYWTPKPDRRVKQHIKAGGDVLLSCHKYMYFDMLHSYCTTKGTYYFDIKKAHLPKRYDRDICGYEGEIWTEFISNEDQLFFMLFNRALALSESAWTLDRDFYDFEQRVERHKKIMDALGISYGPDYLTMKKSTLKKRVLAKKHGIDPKHFDSEYRLSKIVK